MPPAAKCSMPCQLTSASGPAGVPTGQAVHRVGAEHAGRDQPHAVPGAWLLRIATARTVFHLRFEFGLTLVLDAVDRLIG
jgi:hypothetical protein